MRDYTKTFLKHDNKIVICVEDRAYSQESDRGMPRGIAGVVVVREDFLEEAEAINLASEGPASDTGGSILGRSSRKPKKQSYMNRACA